MRGALAILFVLLAPAAARADVRLWQEEETVGVGRDGDEPRHVDLFAFVQPAYAWLEGYDEREHRLLVRRARIGVLVRLYPFLTLRLGIDGAPVRGVEIEDAYLDAEALPAFRVRLGRFEIPFLRGVQFYDAYEAFGQAPPFTVEDLTSGAYGRVFLPIVFPDRDVGAMVHGGLGDADFGPYLDYGAAMFTGAVPRPLGSVDREGFMLAMRIEGHLLGLPIGDAAESDLARNARPRVSVGVGGMTNCNTAGEFERGFVVDGELRWEGLYVSASFLRMRAGAATDESFLGSLLGYDSDAACGPTEGADIPIEHVALAAHAQAQYVLPPLLFPFDSQALEVLARFAVVEPNDPPDGLLGGPGDGEGPPNQWRLTVGLNWYPTAEPIFRLSASYEARIETETVELVTGERASDVDDDVLWVQATAGL